MSGRNRRDFLRFAASIGALGGLGSLGLLPRLGAAADMTLLDRQRVLMNLYYTKDNDFFRGWARGVSEASSQLNLAVREAVTNMNLELQRASIENAPLNQVEGMVTVLQDPGSSPLMLGLAQRQGIAAINNWSTAPWSTPLDIGDKHVAYHTSHDLLATQTAVENMFAAIGGKGRFVNVIGIPGESSSDMRQEGVRRALKKYPGIELIAEVAGRNSRGNTLPVVEGVLTSHGKVDAMFCSSDDSAIGAITALEARKIDALVTSVDGIPDYLDLMKQGRAFQTLALTGGWFAAWSTARIFDKLNGIELSAPETMMYGGVILLDSPESAAIYKTLTYEQSTFPFDYRLMSRALHPDDWDPQNLLAPIDPMELWGPAGWNKTPQPSSYELPPAYRSMMSDGSFEKVKQQYASRFRRDPYAEVRAATRSKQLIV
ncbi:D-ribose-binding periplasmic protein precursor [compost metagenome]